MMSCCSGVLSYTQWTGGQFSIASAACGSSFSLPAHKLEVLSMHIGLPRLAGEEAAFAPRMQMGVLWASCWRQLVLKVHVNVACAGAA